VGSPASRQPRPDQSIHTQFNIQRNWLLNPLPPSREVCPVCRGARDFGYPRCYSCTQAYSRSGGILADAVVPISYSPDDGQHYYQLKVYKSPTAPNRLAHFRLAVLYTLFASTHRACLERVAGGGFTHVATVPSTRARPGMHPLQQIVAVAHGTLPLVLGTANQAYGNTREFQPDRFHIPVFGSEIPPPKVLLLEDLWVTGARADSMAHALKLAGATAVITVALGRQMNHSFPPNRAILDKARQRPFDLNRCPLDDFST
jgi:predicted amidophosphoribosyltransferase